MSTNPELPLEVLQRAIAGHSAALDTLAQAYLPTIAAVVTSRTRGIERLRSQRDDLVNDVWLELCRDDRKRLRYYEPTRGSFSSFLRMQTSQIVWMRIQRELKRPETTELPPCIEHDTENTFVARDQIARLGLLLETHLSESDWALFTGIYVEGMRPDELTERLGKKIKSIYQQNYRLRQKLAKLAAQMLRPEST